jgi:hypothetical protein
MLVAAAYEDEKQMLYQALPDAESKGRFFMAHVRDHFQCERVAKAPCLIGQDALSPTPFLTR